MYYHYHTTDGKCTLENLYLLAAISSTRYCILKIEIETKTNILKRKENEIIEKLDSKIEDDTARQKKNL